MMAPRTSSTWRWRTTLTAPQGGVTPQGERERTAATTACGAWPKGTMGSPCPAPSATHTSPRRWHSAPGSRLTSSEPEPAFGGYQFQSIQQSLSLDGDRWWVNPTRGDRSRYTPQGFIRVYPRARCDPARWSPGRLGDPDGAGRCPNPKDPADLPIAEKIFQTQNRRLGRR